MHGIGRRIYCVAGFFLITVAGCSRQPARPQVFPVHGSVAFEGKPTPGALVVFHPLTNAHGNEPTPIGYVAEDGTFQVGTFDKYDGAPAGKYAVTVQWRVRPKARDDETISVPNVLPLRYSRADKSKLQVEVVAGSNQLERFRLKR